VKYFRCSSGFKNNLGRVKLVKANEKAIDDGVIVLLTALKDGKSYA
jgi:hypothetical protein